MTLTIDLTPSEGARLDAAARQEGVGAAALAKKLVTEHLPPAPPATEEDPTLALFAEWDREDEQMTPEELAAAQKDFAEFKHNINAERVRAGARVIYP
ncbi:MAG: hypothetical protein JO250_06520 [Armatimonadetes bacterium]|nr:hypothetical protein [Armatimonadota bacterium]